MTDRTFTVKNLTERFGVSEGTILGWIKRGELRALDVSRQRGGRPRWRITQEALSDFELLRTHSPSPPPTRRKKRPAEIIKFY